MEIYHNNCGCYGYNLASLWWILTALMTPTLGQFLEGVDTGWGRSPYYVPPSPPGYSRLTTYKDVLSDSSILIYHRKSIVNFAELLVDIPRQQIILGARNHLLRLNITTLEELERTEWPPDEIDMRICQAKGQPLVDCQNYIRVLVQKKDEVFVCGTHAFSPKCSWRKAEDLSAVLRYETGIAKCPYNPHHNNTALMTADGNLYSATVTDFTARDPAIFRVLGPAKHLRTVQYNSRWLNEPHFVSSFEIGEFVYFFFRESAIEYINCGKNVYARVARVCKTDSGGNFLLEDNWTTFIKARMNCSLPGTQPFYFNELQSTYYMKELGLIYAVYNTAPASIYGSAVCVYNLSAFHSAFSGPFKYQENARSMWTRVPNSSPQQCPGDREPHDSRRAVDDSPLSRQRVLVDAMKYQIMDESVQPIGERPLFVSENERYSHIVVDNVFTKHHQQLTVMFLLTLEGALRKVLYVAGSSAPCLLEEVRLVPPGGHPGTVHTMALQKEEGVILIGTEHNVFRIPLQRCSRFTSRQSCIGAQDPYCGWDSLNHVCTGLPETLPSHYWHQNITACMHQVPQDVSVWSEWSLWHKCSSETDLQTGSGPCMCRQRTCRGQNTLSTNSQCTGPDIEVTNCTVHGAWTKWSAWSACSASCGVAVRSRHRFCGNPEPQYGGRVCIGPKVDETYCFDNPDCMALRNNVQDGDWSGWSDWSQCNKPCNGGIQTRRRHCNNPVPRNGGKPCVGNDEQWMECNTHGCEERRRSEWSDWQTVNSSSEGRTEDRYRFTCRASVEDENEIRIGHLKKDTRFCPHGSSLCQKRGPDIIDPVWSPWSEWTTCSALCGSGRQARHRLCLTSAGQPYCDGHGQENMICNTHSCQGEWSCWSDYSSCSSSCGSGRRWRKRRCQAETSGGHYTQPCPGSDREEIPCEQLGPCPDCSGGSVGWTLWGSWGECTEDSVQTRQRTCCMGYSVYDTCEGPQEETLTCQYNEIKPLGAQRSLEDVNIEAVKEPPVAGVSARRAGCRECFCMYHLVIVTLVGFILGGVICVGIFLYCQRQHQEYKDQDKYNTIQRLHQQQQQISPQTPDAKLNDYISPADLHVPGSPELTDVGNQYFNTNSLKHKESYRSLTVKEASLKRNSMLRSNSMRTNLSLSNMEY